MRGFLLEKERRAFTSPIVGEIATKVRVRVSILTEN
jgi:hypothetical protein